MKRGVVGVWALVITAVGVVGIAQEPEPPAVLNQIGGNGKPVKGRLPPNYGKVGVSEAQRQRIYQLQAAYGAKLARLQAEIEALESQRDAEIRAVLTPAQQRQLDLVLQAAMEGKAKKAIAKARQNAKLLEQADAVDNAPVPAKEARKRALAAAKAKAAVAKAKAKGDRPPPAGEAPPEGQAAAKLAEKPAVVAGDSESPRADDADPAIGEN